MKALDRLVVAGNDDANDRYQKAYSLLSEYAHPNSRSVREFLRFEEEPPVGWRVWYSTEEEQDAQGQIMVLSLLAEMMRLGYSACEFLRLGDVVEIDDGFAIRPPVAGEMRRILTRIMLLEDEHSIH